MKNCKFNGVCNTSIHVDKYLDDIRITLTVEDCPYNKQEQQHIFTGTREAASLVFDNLMLEDLTCFIERQYKKGVNNGNV